MFKCNRGSAMRNVDPLGYPRDEVLIFCQGIADRVYGEIAGYKLENGAPIPKCQPNGKRSNIIVNIVLKFKYSLWNLDKNNF